MLAPDDRQLLLSHLQPRPRLRLRHAVGTTFTLDLESALLAPLAAATRVLTDVSKTHPIAILEALRSSVDKIDIFYQNGYLAAPTNYSKLNAFLEQSLHPTRAPKPGHLFHPKLWILEFCGMDDDEPAKYRLTVATRNLTSSVSWDVMVSLDGEPGTRPLATNRPLAALVRALPNLAHQPLPPSRSERISALAETVRRIAWEVPKGVDDITFHAFGVDGERAAPDFSGRRGLVISPYLSADGLDRISSEMQALDVVSRTDQISLIAEPELDKFEANFQVIRPDAGLRSEQSSADGASAATATLLDGLHAKALVAERGAKAHFFTGSVNATENAFTGNVEFLIEIVGSRKEFGVDAILGPQGMGTVLETFTRPDIERPVVDEADTLLENATAMLADLLLTCRIHSANGDHGDDHLSATITSDEPVPLSESLTATVTMAGVKGRSLALIAGSRVAGCIDGLAVDEVTSWARLTIEDTRGEIRSTLVKMLLVGDRADRLDAVIASQIDSSDKFLALLRLLLTLDADAVSSELNAAINGGGSALFGELLSRGLFESLVRGLAAKPQALQVITDLIEQLQKRGSSDVIPTDLLKLWPVFLEASRRRSGVTA